MGRPKPIRRKVEGLFGVPLFDMMGRKEMKHSKLEGPKQIFLPKCGVPMNYFERPAVIPVSSGHACKVGDPKQLSPPTLLLLHGFSSNAAEFCTFLRLLDVPPQVRILVPEMIGHGEDLKRAFQEGSSFQQPNQMTMVQSMMEFLDAARVGSNCNALGMSYGGAVVYYLRLLRPDVIRKTVLVAPCLLNCLADDFFSGIVDGTQSFVDFQSRDDVINLFRNLCWTDPDKRKQQLLKSDADGEQARGEKKPRKDPFPKFTYEVIWRLYQRDVPKGHYKGLTKGVLGTYAKGRKEIASGAATASEINDANNENPAENYTFDNDDIYTTATDLDKSSLRLVVWPKEDQICSFERGKAFFEPAVNSRRTIFEPIPNCGHTFDENGTNILELLAAMPKVKLFLLDCVACDA